MPIHRDDLLVQARYVYWLRDRILDTAASLTAGAFVLGPRASGRTLRETLVHELDVEWSWRARLHGAGGPAADPGTDAELPAADFPDVATLRERWQADEQEMLEWLEALTDHELAAPPLAGGEGSLPLSAFIAHVFAHGVQQLTTAAVLLSEAGASPGDLDFLNAVDALGGDPELRGRS
jgi:uncharacterized damage-inducible protein DinB